MASSRLLHVALILLIAFAVVAVVLFGLLLGIRATRVVTERRRDRRRTATRALLLDVLLGEDDDAVRARTALLRRSGRSWERTEEQVFEMLPKLRGEARDALTALLTDRGTMGRARRLSRSLSAVRRCRGVFALGVLDDHASLPRMTAMLEDRSYLVRRTTVRALGNLGDPAAVQPLLALVAREPRLSRDVVYALDRIGTVAAPILRAELRDALDHPGDEHPEADLAAAVLGLIGDFRAADLLARGLRATQPGLDVACAEALGQVGTADVLPDLVAALDSDRPALRTAAAHALGLLGASEALEDLVHVLDAGDPLLARSAAAALRQLGEAGMAALRASSSPYAVETVALSDLRNREVRSWSTR
ncbi:MAG: HEAT repeat domain-containing protein [Marmoricola sp.]